MIYSEGTVGWRIYGIGADEGTDEALTLGYGTQAEMDASGLSTWIGDGLDSIPTEGARRVVDDIAGTYSTSPLSVDIKLHAVTSALLMAQPGAPIASLTATVDESSTTLEMTSGQTGLVHIGREGVLLGVEGPPGEYTGCVRGYQGGRATAHNSGALVTRRTAWWVGRRCALIHVVDGVEIVRWRGLLTRQGAINAQATVITLPANEVTSVLGTAQVNEAAPDLRAYGQMQVRRGIDFDTLEGTLSGYVRRTTKAIACRTIALQVQDALFVGEYSPVTNAELITLPGVLAELSSGEVRLVDDDAQAAVFALTGPVHEIFVVSPELDELYSGQGGVSPTYRMDYPYHPLSIALAMWTSTRRDTEQVDPLFADVLGSTWALDLTASLDLTAWANAIEATPWQQVDVFVAGWDGKPYAFKDLAVMLRAWGWALAPRQGGALRPVQAARPISLEEGADPNGITILSPEDGGSLSFDPGAGAPAGRVTANVGARPWGVSAVPVAVTVGGEDAAEGAFRPVAALELDMATLAVDDALGWGSGEPEAAVSAATRYARALTWRIPHLTVRATDPQGAGFDYDLHSVVQVVAGGPSDARVPLPDGTLSTLPGDDDEATRLLGRIVASSMDPRDGTHELTLRLDAYASNALARWRAPNALVDTLTSGTSTITFATTEGEDFGSGGEPTAHFLAGDEVSFVHINGAAVTGATTATVSTAGVASVVLDSWPFSPDPDPLELIVMRIAPSNVYSNTAHISPETRPFVHLANTSEEIDHDSSVEDADIWG